MPSREFTVQCFSAQEPLHDGVATYAKQLNNALESLGVQVQTPNKLFWLFYPFRKKFIPDFINVRENKYFMLSSSLYFNPKTKADISHFHLSGSAQSLIVLKNYRRVTGPKVITLHEKFMVRKPDFLDQSEREKIIRESDAVIVHTSELRDHASRIHHNVHLIRHPASDQMFQEYSSSEIKQSLGIHRKLVLNMGFLAENKGIELILKIAPLFKDEAQFMVVGEAHIASYYQYLEKLDSSHILVPGYIDVFKFRQLLRAADVVLLPRSYTQGECSGVMVEAMAAGKIIVASNIGCFKEYLGDDRGILVEQGDVKGFEDGVRKALRSESEEIALRAKTFAERFLRFEEAAKEHIKVYESVLNKDR